MEYSEKLGQDLKQAFTRRFAAIWRDVLAPQLRQATPVRSGQLQRAMQIGYRDGRFVVFMDRSGFYWRFQKGLPAKYKKIYDHLLPAMVNTALQQAKADVGLDAWGIDAEIR